MEYTIFDWTPERGARMHLVPLDPVEKVRTFTAPTFCAFHYGNVFASEDGERMCFGVAMYKDPTIVRDLNMENLMSGDIEMPESSLCRFELPLGSSADGTEVSPWNLAPGLSYYDFPSFNEEYRGRRSR
eukprot:evm.model.scf_1710.2 EVM.evm.TU.scf_1710.2   scf_1710:10034-11572(-)